MSMNRILAALLAIVMVMSLAVCAVPAASAEEEPRTITIGVWYDIYYDSNQESAEDDPSYGGKLQDDMRFENVARVEEKYNVRFEYVNLTYEGVRDSINTSILAGTPDCDIYLLETQFGVPAALGGLALDLKSIPELADCDALNDQKILSYLDLGDGKATMLKQVQGSNVVEATWPLAFNVQLLEDNNLEDPRELYARGEWTWDKFVEYLQVLTQDTDGDGNIDQFGMDAFSKDLLMCLMLSNNATIAAGKTETLTSTETGECLQFLYDLYFTYNVMEPYVFDSPWDVCRFRYRDGNVGFWPGANWIFGNNNDYLSEDGGLEFDTAFVQWPIGPSGNQETNRGKLVAGAWWMIPNGVEDPVLVYNVFEDITNWYQGDTELRDDPDSMEWWYTCNATDEDLQQENFAVMFDIGSREQFDLWDSCGVEMDMDAFMRGELTPSQMQEQHKQQYQEKLDIFFG